MCMANLAIEETQNIYYLERTLQHPTEEIKLIGLYEIQRIVDKSLVPPTFNENIQITLIKCLEHESVNVATVTIKILSAILPVSMDAPIRSTLANTLKVAADLIRCRIYECAINIAKISEEQLGRVEFIIAHLFADFDTDDILLQLNILDFLSNLALASHGLVYLENKGIFAKITKNVQSLESNPLKSIITPGYMKFFGNIAKCHPEKIILEFPLMINSLFDCILDTDVTILPVAFDTFGKKSDRH